MQIGVVGPEISVFNGESKGLGRPAVEGESPVGEVIECCIGYLSRAGSVNPCLNLAAPSAKAKYTA